MWVSIWKYFTESLALWIDWFYGIDTFEKEDGETDTEEEEVDHEDSENICSATEEKVAPTIVVQKQASPIVERKRTPSPVYAPSIDLKRDFVPPTQNLTKMEFQHSKEQPQDVPDQMLRLRNLVSKSSTDDLISPAMKLSDYNAMKNIYKKKTNTAVVWDTYM